MPLVRTIASINQKGGVGKTTTTANLGAAIAARGADICLLDLDPQSHLTLHFDIEPAGPQANTYGVLTGQASLRSTAIKVREHLWVAPAVIDLAAVEIELATTSGRERLLRQRLAADDLPFEYLMIDCPPSLGLLTVNALAAADDVLIPLQPHFLSLHGLGRLLETISLVQHRINPDLRVGGVILCMYEQNTRLAAEVTADVKAFFGAARSTDCPWANARIFETVIRRNIKLAECPSFGQTIFEYEPNSNGARDYNALGDEFMLWARGLGQAPESQVAVQSEPDPAQDLDTSEVDSVQAAQTVHEEAVEDLLEETSRSYLAADTPPFEDNAADYLSDQTVIPAHGEPPEPNGGQPIGGDSAQPDRPEA